VYTVNSFSRVLMQVVFLRTLIVVMPRRFCAFLPYKKRQHHARRYVPKGASLCSGSGPGCIGDCTSAPVGPGALCTTVSAGVSVAICCFYCPLLFLTRSRLWTVIHGRAWWAGRPALRFARRGGGGFALRPVAAGCAGSPCVRRHRPVIAKTFLSPKTFRAYGTARSRDCRNT
jgi:hypothetical protein